MLKTNQIQIRDPFIFKQDETYYLFGSTDKNIWWNTRGVGFDAYVSHNLSDWEGPNQAFRPAEDFWGMYNFWAPEIHRYHQEYYMFATFRGETGTKGTAILKADSILGPYIPWSDGKITPESWESLDGTLFIDRGGQPWMVFCHEWVQSTDGTVCAIPLTGDLKRACGEAIVLFRSSDAAWSQEVSIPDENLRGYVTDGCFFHRLQSGVLLMLWSCIGEDGYCIGYAVSKSGELQGPWRQSEEPLFRKDGGHGMVFADNAGRLYLTIHQPNDTPNERAVFFELEELPSGLRIKHECP